MCKETSEKNAGPPKPAAVTQREGLLKSALKANMAKRKAQARARAAQNSAVETATPEAPGSEKG
ncbi:hypothetical protein [Pseudogemmobacter faecipullorum]|uniref:hypothetical protein n=1 Tax=Pseudogemmobacter faecipullorum TaxID=2755041 RepID=UPI001D035180|nr:hypothetical protein [Pseudogemmobacter faecipullorum]